MNNKKAIDRPAWFYLLIYSLLTILGFLPPYTEIPYDPRNTQAVIMEILMRSTQPYAAWGWLFHPTTLGVIALAILRPQIGGRAIAVYFGLDYLIIAAIQTHAITDNFGLAIQTGALIVNGLLGILWLWAAWRNGLTISFKDIPVWRWFLSPLALLVFWGPIAVAGNRIVFNFDPILLLTSPDYGLTYCFMTPVFLFVLILAYPNVDRFAFRVTAFNALLYGLLNLVHWFSPDRIVLGIMHLPLLLLAIVALGLPRFASRSQPQPI